MPRLWLRLCVSASLCAALASAATARTHHHHHEKTAPPGFDGVYSVQITTTDGHGNCPGSYSGTLTIRNFRVVALSDPAALATGGIEDDGTVSLAFRKNDQIANAGGQIKGSAGKGFWSSPTALCGGLWRAERQN
jgi:hypothetical protein